MRIEAIGLKETIKHLEEYRNNLTSKQHEIIQKLAEMGIEVARTRFQDAQYAGENGRVTVGDVVWKSNNEAYFVASGEKVLFVEFGTGTYFEEHPDPKGYVRGAFGQGQGANPPWEYAGELGINPPPGTEYVTNKKGVQQYSKDGEPLVRTMGNPPARGMYDAERTIRDKIHEVAKEVFHD